GTQGGGPRAGHEGLRVRTRAVDARQGLRRSQKRFGRSRERRGAKGPRKRSGVERGEGPPRLEKERRGPIVDRRSAIVDRPVTIYDRRSSIGHRRSACDD